MGERSLTGQLNIARNFSDVSPFSAEISDTEVLSNRRSRMAVMPLTTEMSLRSGSLPVAPPTSRWRRGMPFIGDRSSTGQQTLA